MVQGLENPTKNQKIRAVRRSLLQVMKGNHIEGNDDLQQLMEGSDWLHDKGHFFCTKSFYQGLKNEKLVTDANEERAAEVH